MKTMKIPNKQDKNVSLFISSQTISLFGSALVQYAITWYITLETQSGVMMMISAICGFLPTFILSPFAGVWADRFDRKKLIVWADAFIAISTFVLAIIFLFGYRSMWLLFVVAAIRALGSAIQSPAVNAFLPQFVSEDKLTKVNAINGTIQSVIFFLAPMLSGFLLSISSIEFIFFIDVITALIAIAVLYFFLDVPPHERANQPQAFSYFGDLKEGFQYMKAHHFVYKYFQFTAVFMFMATPVAFLTPLQVTRTFGSDVWRLTAIELTFSVGMALGGLLMSTWGGFKNRIVTMGISSLIMGMVTVLLGVTHIFWMYLGLMMLFGLIMPLFNTPSTVLLQEKVEPAFLGRIFSILSMIASLAMPIGMGLFGPLADIVRIEYLLVGTGSILAFLGFLMLNNKLLLEAGQPRLVEIESLEDVSK